MYLIKNFGNDCSYNSVSELQEALVSYAEKHITIVVNGRLHFVEVVLEPGSNAVVLRDSYNEAIRSLAEICEGVPCSD